MSCSGLPAMINSFVYRAKISGSNLSNKELKSALNLEKPNLSKTHRILKYQTHGACINPYKAFFNLNSWVSCPCTSKPSLKQKPQQDQLPLSKRESFGNKLMVNSLFWYSSILLSIACMESITDSM
jgi:hypothetical protein